jgi:hypothetical protein
MARTKGAKNKYGAQAKENIVAVFNRLGGTKAMADWAKDHQSDFYRMYAALAPKEITGDFTIRDESDLSDAELAAIATGRGEGVVDEASGEEVAAGIH